MNPHVLAHRLALLCLTVVAGLSLGNVVRWPNGVQPGPLALFVIAVNFWGWLLYNLWRAPRRWSLGSGLLFVFMLFFQTYLWWHALDRHTPMRPEAARNPWVFALYELPIATGAVCCFYLRRNNLPL